MRTNARIKTTLALLLIAVGTVASAQTRHWIGGSGSWTDPAHWSLVANGTGGAGVPRAADAVIIAPAASVEISIPRSAVCASLLVDGSSGPVRVVGDQRSVLAIAGDWRMSGTIEWTFTGTVRMTGAANGMVVDLHGIPLMGSLLFDGAGTWDLLSDLALREGDVTLREGTVVMTDGLMTAHGLCTEGRRPKQLIADRSVVVVQAMPDRAALRNVVRPDASTLSVAGSPKSWTDEGSSPAIPPVVIEDRDINVCGTGPGQTPFTVNAQLTSSYNGFGVRCRGECNGTVTVSVTGGIGPFTYSWLFGGPNTATWTTACGGPQIVVVTDGGQGISCPAQVNVTEPAPLGIIFFGQGTPPTCAGVCNGSRTALAIGGVPGYTYNWNNGAGSNSSFFQLCAGNNTLRITDLNGCIKDTTFFFDLLPISPNLITTNTSCFGQCNGSATVAPTGGTPPFTITWTPVPPNGQGGTTASDLCAGNYTVLLVDANGCDTTLAFLIEQPPPIVPNSSFTNASCFGVCDGTAMVAPTGSPGPFTYDWTPAPGSGGGTSTVTGLCAGLYTVLITDQITGCDTLVPITIISPPAIDVQGTVTDATCATGCDGAIDLVITGGTLPLTITWSPAPPVGQGTPNVSGLCPGPWQVTVADAAGCDTTVQFTIMAPPPIIPGLVTTDVTCAGLCDGTATTNVSGGVPPYTFLWTPAPGSGQGTPAVTDLCAGPYTVLITDANGCDTLVAFLINEPPPLLATPSQTNVTCGGSCDGTATVDVSGGTAPYAYSWTPAPPLGQGTNSASELCAGPISVLITDDNGCTLTVPFIILDAVPIELSLQVLPATCPGICDGSADVIASGGTAPYLYVWAPAPGTGQGTPNVTGLCPQAYTLTVTDAVGCDTTIAFTVPAPLPITVTSTVINATCAGDCNGSIDLVVSGGNGVFTYVWTPAPSAGQGTGSVSGLCPGPWDVTITSGACDTTLSFIITAPPPIDASLVPTDPTCAGVCDGSATATVSGGTLPYIYLWAPAPITGQGTPNATALCPGNYTLTVTDAVGCDTLIAFTINEPVPIVVSIQTTPASCGGACDGTATASPLGGTGPYTYLWAPGNPVGQGTPSVSGLCPGAYTLTVTDSLGCPAVVPFAISTPSGIDAVPTVDHASCSDICDGSIDVVTTGGLPPYVFLWTPPPPIGQGTPNASGLCAGVWSLQITDAALCDTVILVTILSPPAIVPNGTSTNETCNGPCDGTASVAPTGGQAPFTYTWTPPPPNGQGTPNATELCPGSWSVLIVDALGCDTTIVLDVMPKNPVVDGLVWTDSPCANECGGTAEVFPTGGTPPYTYLWSPNPPVGQGTSMVSGLCIGLWEIRVFDVNGCFSGTTFPINAPPAITAGLVVTPETCAGPCTGTATVTPAGGVGPISIDWQPDPITGQGTPTATGLCAGTNYTVTLTDVNGCDTTFAFIVQPFAEILPNSSSTMVSCAGACNATATVGPTGGVAPYTYIWSPPPGGGQGTPQATGLCAGVISVTITDVNNCSITTDILILQPDSILDNATVSEITCAGLCNGSISLTPSGGVAPYAYLWSPAPPSGQGTPNATGLCAGTWNVTITDANGCSALFSYELIEPTALSIVVLTTQSDCQLCIGAATAVISGGTAPYSIAWRNAGGAVIGTDPDIIDLCAGIYTVTVTDANGCVQQQVVPITDTNGEVLTMTNGTTSCPNTCDGAVSVAFTCADPPCTIAWFDIAGNDLGQSGNALAGLCPGDYYALITNGSGCISIDTATVTAPPPTTLNISSTAVQCAGDCDGTATVGVSGGIPPYTFVWDPPPGGGQGTPFATGLCAGVYTISISDGGGCDTTAQVLITEPDPLVLNAIVIDIGCAGQCDGNVTLPTSGGTAPYTYVWSPVPPSGQGVPGAFGLCAGDWTVTVTDANGCTLTETYTINEPQPLQVTVDTTPSTCPNCDGTASAIVSGGTGPFIYDWSLGGVPISSDPSVTDLCGGLYILTITDVNGCSVTQVVIISDSNAEVLTPVDGQTLCANGCDGSVGVTFTCTAPPCTLQWTDAQGNVIAQNLLVVTNLCVGTYTAQVTNGNGCVSFANASVLPAQVIVPNLSSTPASCAGACDGTATVGPIGGTEPYVYVWDPPPGGGQGTAQATGLCAGVYSVSITDANLCDTTVQVLILEPQPIDLNGAVQDITCNGNCDGAISVIVSGGTAPYVLVWSPVPPVGQGTNAISGLCAVEYTLTVTDANGCTASQSWTVAEPAALTAAGSSTQSECGICNGTASVAIAGGTAPYFVQWTQGGNIIGTGESIGNLCAGFYTATITDANLCSIAQLVPVSDLDGEVTTMTDGTTTCPGDCDGSVNVDFTCSDPPCTIAWFDAIGTNLNESSNQLGGLCAGLYLVQVTNGTGCITIDTAFVADPDPIVPNLSTTPVTCFGACDGTATVGPTGGQPPYDYVWAPGSPNGQGTPQVTDLCGGTWSVTISDAAGCSIVVDVLILEPPPLVLTETITPITCNGACDGVISVVASGGVAPYVLTWDPVPPNGQGVDTATDLCADTYNLTVTDANGCDSTYTYTLIDPPVLDAQVDVTDNVCYGDCIGIAEVTINGGVAPYTIVWRDVAGTIIAQDTTLLDGLCAGGYTVEITDANGCLFNLPFTVGEGQPIIANLVFIGETCFGPCDGTASVSPTGGVGPYTYFWQPEPGTGQGTDHVTGLCADNWTVTITDALNCDTTYVFTIAPYQEIADNATVSQVQCNGACDGSIELAATGGVGPLTFDWSPVPSNGQGNPQATGLCPDVWTVTISDAVGCDSIFSFTITEPTALDVTIDLVVDASCADADDGAIDATTTGGTSPYDFEWNGPGGFTAQSEDISGLFPGDYTLTVTDDNGCVLAVPVTVAALSTVIADAGADQTVCNGVATTLDGSMSTGGTVFQWTNDQGVNFGNTLVLDIGALPAGTHTFTLAVIDGPCTSTDQVVITVLALPIANAGIDQTIFTGDAVTLGGSPTGPQGSIHLWAPDSLLNNGSIANPIATPTATTWFTVLVTAPNGCQALDSVLVTVVPEIRIPTGFTPNGDGWNDMWVIDFIDLFPESEVEVYNRWGDMLFRSVGYKQPWDGKYSGGFVPVGTYYYVIKLNDPRFPDDFTGPLTVIR